MAGHSHWDKCIKHLKKGKKQRSTENLRYFLSYQKKLLQAAKLGDKDPAMDPRLEICYFKLQDPANMPKDNIERRNKAIIIQY